MTTKVIYTGCNKSFWLDVAERLRDDLGWEPCYWISTPRMEPRVKERFPDIVFHSNLDAMRGIAAPEYKDVPLIALDKPLLDGIAAHEITVLNMMDRMDALGSFDYHSRVHLYHQILRHWLTIVDEVNPDMVIYSNIPVAVYDYVLYLLCRQRGIQSTMFEFTKVRGLVYAMRTFEGASPVAVRYEQLLAEYAPGTVNLSPATEQYLKTIAESHQETPSYIRSLYAADTNDGLGNWVVTDTEEKHFGFVDYVPGARTLLRPIWRSGLRLYKTLNPRVNRAMNHFKLEGKKIEDSWMTGRQYQNFERRAKRRMRQLKAYYYKLAQPVDLNHPYIYLALNFQPERTTLTQGDVFVDQLLMVDLLAKTLPQGWHLYVKEHPVQFDLSRAFRAQACRTMDFYDDLAAMPQVKLVPLSVSTFDLIDNSKAVASVNGTVGWEALIRGKPALEFGYPWYRGCEGDFAISSQENCAKALGGIASGYKVELEKVRLFIRTVEELGFTAYIDGRYDSIVGASSDETNAAAIACGVKRFWAAEERVEVAD